MAWTYPPGLMQSFPSMPMGVGAVMLKALGLQLKVGVGVVVVLETASVCVGRAEKDDVVSAFLFWSR